MIAAALESTLFDAATTARLARALAWIAQTDMVALAPGRHDIAGDEVYANVMEVTPDPSAPTPEPILRTGSRGQEVKDLQGRLQALGYYAGEIDGQFGAMTKEAVISFQKANGLDADGMVGSETKSLLFSVNAKPLAGSGE